MITEVSGALCWRVASLRCGKPLSRTAEQYAFVDDVAECSEFAILSRGRSGSTALADDLNSHPSIVCHQEIFTASRTIDSFLGFKAFHNFNADHGGNISVDQYFAEMRKVRSVGATVLGCKLLINHFHENDSIGLKDYVLSGQMKLIFNIREPVSAAISAVLAERREIYNVHRIKNWRRLVKLRNIPPIVLDVSRVVDEIRYEKCFQQLWIDKLSSSSLNYIVVKYDDYVLNRTSTLNRCYDFLDVAPHPIRKCAFVKVTSPAYLSDIENRGELIAAIAAAGFDPAPLILSEAQSGS